MTKSRADRESASEVPHPRETTALFGHAEAERTLLDAYATGRAPHAWLIGGPDGIGKATLAYRFARFVLAHPDPATDAVRQATSLAVPADDTLTRRIAARTEGGLLTLERTPGEKSDQVRTVITVDQVRATSSFFGDTAAGGGARVCIIDTAEDLKFPEGANALLKVLEEPPARAFLLLVSHAPGRLLATIRSRCRVLTMRPLAEPDVVAAVATALGREADEQVLAAARLADGSVARAIALCGGPIMALREQVNALLGRLPEADPRALHGLADTLERADRTLVDTFVDTVRDWVSGEIHRTPHDLRRIAPLAEAFSRIDAAAREQRTYNLDRRPLVFAVFGWLAEAARG